MRKRLFTLRMTNDEMRQLEERAFNRKMKVSEYARAALIGAPAKPREVISGTMGMQVAPVVPTDDKITLVRDEDYQEMV